MSKKWPKIKYDEESEVLSIQVNDAKSVDSDVQGSFVVDYDEKDEVVRVNIYDFSFDDFKKSKKALNKYARNSGASMQRGK